MKILFSPSDIGIQEAEEVTKAICSGWITTGPRTKEFERQIAAYCHTEKAVCLDSATAYMESILRLLGVGQGDEVITSAYTYIATASVIAHVFGAQWHGKMWGEIAEFTSFSFHVVKNFTMVEGEGFDLEKY